MFQGYIRTLAAILWLQFTVRVMLLPAINRLSFYISQLSYYNQLSAQCQYLMLQLKHYITQHVSNFIVHHQGDHISVVKNMEYNKYLKL